MRYVYFKKTDSNVQMEMLLAFLKLILKIFQTEKYIFQMNNLSMNRKNGQVIYFRQQKDISDRNNNGNSNIFWYCFYPMLSV